MINRPSPVLASLATFAILVGCTAEDKWPGGQADKAAPRHVAPIAPDQVESYLAGATIPPPASVSDVPTEAFFEDGRYLRQGRGLEEGAYDVSGNRVCVRLPPAGDAVCRYAYLVDGKAVLSTAAEAVAVTAENSGYLKRDPSSPVRRGTSGRSAEAAPISEGRARAALVGQTISRSPDVTESGSERFAADGGWLLMALDGAEGRYAIRGNQVCVTVTVGNARPGCRYLYAADRGLVLSTSSDPAEVAPSNFIPIAYDRPD